MIRYRANGYSVSAANGYWDVIVRMHAYQVVISRGSEFIAYSYGQEEFIINPIHNLALLGRKAGSPVQAVPLLD